MKNLITTLIFVCGSIYLQYEYVPEPKDKIIVSLLTGILFSLIAINQQLNTLIDNFFDYAWERRKPPPHSI